MKKSIIATGAASLVLAAMPVLGAFANSITDTVTITIDGACSVGSTDSSTGNGTTITDTLENGDTETYEAGTSGGTIKVSCNDSSGWHITAVGSGDGSPVTSMKPSATSTAIPTSANATDASYWQFQVTGTNTVAAFNAFTAIPGSATKVAGNNAAVSEGTINTGYKVHVSTTQAADTYTGKVTYTVNTGVGN